MRPGSENLDASLPHGRARKCDSQSSKIKIIMMVCLGPSGRASKSDGRRSKT